MVLASYVLGRASARFLLLLAIFLAILAGGQIALFMARGVPPVALAQALWPIVMLSLPIAFPLAMSTAVLVSLGAMQRDGELRALAACGIGAATVASRLWPLVAAGVLASALLWHVLMPQAMAETRANKGRLSQAAVAYNVAAQRPIFTAEGVRVLGRSAAGRTLHDIHLTQVDDGIVTTLHAAEAGWYLARDADAEGLGIEARNVHALRRWPDGRVLLLESPSAQYPVIDTTPEARDVANPDSLSTPRVLALLHDPPSLKTFHNARLTFHLRLYTPVALAAFCVLAAGLALVLRSSDSLVGIIIMVVLVSSSTLPAVLYVKNTLEHPHLHPAWLLWPPAAAMLAIGLWMLLHPERARETAGRPLDAIGGALARLKAGAIQAGRGTVVAARRSVRTPFRARDGRDALAHSLAPRGLRTLDRFVLQRTGARWVAVLFIGTFLIALGDFMGKVSGPQLRGIVTQPLIALQYLLFRLPEFVALWLPLSALTAAMLLAGPMLRQGAIMMLSASGIAPRRVFAALLPFGALVGLLSLLLADQVVPRTNPIAADLEDQLTLKVARDGSLQRALPRSLRATDAAWRTPDAFWAAQRGVPSRGIYEQVVAFGERPGAPLAVAADRLAWEDGGWTMDGVTVVTAAGMRRLERATPAELGVPIARDRRTLALDLRPEHAKTSDELLRAPTPRTWPIILLRLLNALTPLLCLMIALPRFTRWENRHRLGSATAWTLILALVPFAMVAVSGRLLTATDANPFAVAGALAGVLLTVAGIRWLRLRV